MMAKKGFKEVGAIVILAAMTIVFCFGLGMIIGAIVRGV